MYIEIYRNSEKNNDRNIISGSRDICPKRKKNTTKL